MLEVSAESPADRAAWRVGDILRQVGGTAVKDEGDVADAIHAKSAGDNLPLVITHAGKPIELLAKLEPPSRPMASGRARAVLGVQLVALENGSGVRIDQVHADSAAERAKLKVGDIILKIDGIAVSTADKLIEILLTRKPDDTVTLTMGNGDKMVETPVKLAAEPGANNDRPAAVQSRRRLLDQATSRYRRRRIDVKHNEKITPEAWEEAMFSQGTYTKTSVTGQPMFRQPPRLLPGTVIWSAPCRGQSVQVCGSQQEASRLCNRQSLGSLDRSAR